jgi:hypothetical protein
MLLQDFSKFLSLLKMSGVLKPGADLTAVLQAGDRKHRPGIAGVLKQGADLKPSCRLETGSIVQV